ncbi:MAG: helix-turn-helix transcriptional regulator [Clostridiales bacterium]|nr:helix-turn-helix transcriptional regulator [Clostridiales bacterium]
MKNKLKYYFKSTFVRYTLSYVVIMMLLLTSIMVYMYSYYQNSIYDNTRDSQTNKLASVRHQSEGYVRMLSGIANQLGMTAAREPFDFDASPAKARALISALEPHMATADFCRQIYVVLDGEDRVYYAGGSENLDDFVEDSLHYEELSPMELKNVLFTKTDGRMIECQWVEDAFSGRESERMVSYILPLGENGSGNALFLIAEETFLSMLDDETADISNRYILSGGEIVVKSENFILDEDYVIRASGDGKEMRTHTKLLGGQKYLFISMPSDMMNLTYFSAIPLTSITRIAANGWVDFVWILLVFAVPCILFMVLISRNNQRIIREMGKKFHKDDDAYADYILAIRTGIKELEGKNQDLDKKLTQSRPAQKIMFVKSLVKGYFQSDSEALAAAEQAGVDISRPYFEILLLGAPENKHPEVYLEKLLSEMPEDVSLAGTDLLSQDQMLIVAFADDASRLRAFAQEIWQKDEVRESRLPVAVSDVHEGISEMQTAYLEASSAYDNRFVMGDMRLLSFKDMPHAAKNVVPQAKGYIEAIKQAMSLGDIDMMHAQLDELVRFLRDTDMSLYAFRQIYNDVIGAIMSLTADDETDALKYYDLFTLSSCRSLDELDGILRTVLTEVMQSSKSEDKRPLIQNILAFMTESYTDPAFTLAAVAEKFSLTTTRLTLEFKENMHMTPSDYLTMLRMEHAKKLLKQTDMSIKDICAEVGYSDVSSYIRRFKQYTSLTPLQYRQNAKGAEE